jgi:tetratricopeptide (TPR) repeat protein
MNDIMKIVKKEGRQLWFTGYNYFLKGEYEKATKVYEEVINKEHDEYGYLLMGVLNKRLKQYDDAIKNFNMFIKLSDKKKCLGYGYRGLTKLNMALDKQAFEDIMKSIELKIEVKKKDIKKEELDKFYKILKTYKKGNVNNPQKRIYSIPIDISGFFKSCIYNIGINNKYAIDYLQHLSNIYSQISTWKTIHKG